MSRRAWAALVIAAASLVYLLRLDRVAGLMVDDAWYILLAKALASGEGYRLISSATVPIMPVVPPGFPALLAPLFAVNPSFPANLLLLKVVSVLAMAGVGIATYYYALECRRAPAWVAGAVATATVLTPALVFLATSTVMAEAVFTLAQILTVILLDRDQDETTGVRRSVAAGAMAAAAVLVRSAGVAVLAGGVLYLLHRRQWRRTAAFAAAAGVSLVPWLLYSATHAPMAEQSASHGGTIAYAYSDLLTMRRAGNTSAGQSDIWELPSRVSRNLVNVLGRDLGGVFVPGFYRGPSESGEETVGLGGVGASMGSAPGTMGVSFALAAVVLAGLVTNLRSRPSAADALTAATLAMVVIVPTRTFRYLLPLAPFLWLYLASGVRALGELAAGTPTPGRIAPVRIVMTLLIALQLIDHAQFLRIKAESPVAPPWQADARAVEDLLNWMGRTLPADAAIASTNPGLIYLRSGRKGVVSADLARNLEVWKGSGIRYIAALRPQALPARSLGLRTLYESRGLWVVEIPG